MKGTLICWQGEGGLAWRAVVSVQAHTPVIRRVELDDGSGWRTIETELRPHFEITTGIRKPDANRGRDYDNRWWVYGDPPMNRTCEVETNLAQYHTARYTVKRDGARTQVDFDGVTCRFFQGGLRITVYDGSNLMRVELIMTTQEPSMAYLYRGGLRGFSAEAVSYIAPDRTEVTGEILYGPTDKTVKVRSRGRNLIARLESGVTVAVCPPPHAFFFARQLENIVGYTYYRPERDGLILGVRHNEKGEYYSECPNHRAWACYNAPPGTSQHMAAFFYFSTGDFAACRQALLAYTHGDAYQPLPGYKTLVNHFHMAFGETWEKDPEKEQDWIRLFKELGVNIACLNDFHANGHEYDNTRVRIEEFKTYLAACRRFSTPDFLIMPSEEPNCGVGGHWNLFLPRPQWYSRSRAPGQPFEEQIPEGTYYHLSNLQEVTRFLFKTGGLFLTPHPRTKANEEYPDAYLDSELFRSRNYLGIGFRYMPADLSFERLGDGRNFDTLDELNNLSDHPKYILGEVDTYKKTYEYDLYGDFNVNYVKLDRPVTVDDTSALVEAFTRGDWFVTTGEVLLDHYRVEDGQVRVTLSWTFPMDFCEIVYSDGEAIGQRVMSLTDRRPFGSEQIAMDIPAGMKWVRFTAWDCAKNGAFTQPIFLK